MKERDIEKHLVKRVKALGGEVRKVQWIGRRGAPDRLVMVPQRGVIFGPHDEGSPYRGPKHEAATIWVELKAPGVEPETHQLREHARMQAMGQRVVVIDSIEGVDALLA